jgi:hypothetical protein
MTRQLGLDVNSLRRNAAAKNRERNEGCEAVPVGDTWSLVQGGDSACGRRFLGVVTCDPAGGFHRPFASDCAIGRWSWGVGGVVLNSRPLLSATVLGRARSRRFAAALRLGMRHDVPSRIGMPTSCGHQSRRGHPALVPTAGTRRVYALVALVPLRNPMDW